MEVMSVKVEVPVQSGCCTALVSVASGAWVSIGVLPAAWVLCSLGVVQPGPGTVLCAVWVFEQPGSVLRAAACTQTVTAAWVNIPRLLKHRDCSVQCGPGCPGAAALAFLTQAAPLRLHV